MMNTKLIRPLFCTRLLACFFFCHVLICPAQNEDIRFRRLEAEELLAGQRIVFNVTQDANGFMWLGPVRYDGKSATPYANYNLLGLKLSNLLQENWGKAVDSLVYFDPKRDSFIHNVPQSMESLRRGFNSPVFFCGGCFAKDASKNVWLGTLREGLFLYDYSSKAFRKEDHQKDNPASLSSNKVSAVLRDSLDQMWVSTWGGGLNLWLEPGKFRHFRAESDNPASLSSDTIFCMQQDQQGIVWLGTSQGLCRLDPATATIQRMTLPGKVTKTILKIFVHSSGQLWLGIRGRKRPTAGKVLSQIAIFDPAAEEVQTVFEDLSIYWPWDPSFSIMVEDHLERVWMASEGQGIYIYDYQTKQLTQHLRDPRNPSSLSSNRVRELCRDHHNRIWIGTFNGVSIYDPNLKVFHHFESDSEYKHFFNSENKWSGLEDPEGNIWISSRGAGLIKLDPVTKSIKVYKVDSPAASETMRNDFINIESDDRGNIWGTTFSRAIYVLNQKTETFTLLPTKAHGGVTKDSQGRIWVGGSTGLYVFTDPESPPIFYGWDAMHGPKLQLPGGAWPTEIREDCDGNIWVSGDFPLIRFNPKDQSVRQIKGIPELNWFVTLLFDRNCDLWMGSAEHGLIYLSKAEQVSPTPKPKFWHQENSAIPNSQIRGIAEDRGGKLWLGTNAEIIRFDPNTGTFLTYEQEQGFKTHCTGMVIGKDGTIYSAGMNGIGYFHPERLAENDHPPSPFLTDIYINGQSIVHQDSLPFPSPLQESITYARSIELQHWQNELTFEFIALNYTYQENNRYEYQLTGYDQAWKTTDGSDPKATYTNLSPGSYTFRLLAKNNDGYESEEALALKIYIAPPWWLTPAAYLLYGLLAAAGIWGIIRLRTSTLRKRQRVLEQVVDERTAEVVAQKEVILKEKERSDELLLNILPAETADELKQYGTAQAKNYDLVTVLFTDFKGFTKIAEKLSPQQLVAEIHHCYEAFDRIVEKHNVEKIKTIGDAYMAAAGLPTPSTDNPVDAVRAALAIRDFMAAYQVERIAQGREPFEIRIGVHTGPVVAGIVGIKKFAYDIWGDTVNTAARMESTCEVGRVNVSQATYELLKDQEAFRFTPRGKIKAKNKGEIEMYFVE